LIRSIPEFETDKHSLSSWWTRPDAGLWPVLSPGFYCWKGETANGGSSFIKAIQAIVVLKKIVKETKKQKQIFPA